MNYLPMNEGLRKDLLERGFLNTNGNHFHKVAGMYTLRVWVYNRGGQAEVKSRISLDSYNRVARLAEFDTISEVDQFFAKYEETMNTNHAHIAAEAGVKYLGTSEGLFWFNYGAYTFTLNENNVTLDAIEDRIAQHIKAYKIAVMDEARLPL